MSKLRTWRTKFVWQCALPPGEALYVSGDCEQLGDQDPLEAVAMEYDDQDRSWSVVVDTVPEGTRYRYLVRTTDGQMQSVTGYWLQLLSLLDHTAVVDGVLVADDRTRTVKFSVRRHGAEAVYLTGSLERLGEWDRGRALKLSECGEEPGVWQTVVSLPAEVLQTGFEYKFFERPAAAAGGRGNPAQGEGVDDDGIRFESGPNRVSDLHLVEPLREAQPTGELQRQLVAHLECVWEGLLVRFIIYHPLETPGAVLAIAGDGPLGGWLGEPKRMSLGAERTLLTGIKGRCWELTFAAAGEDVHALNYRYCIVDPQGTGVFEREPNRVIRQLPGASRAACVGRAGLALPDLDPDNPRRQREWQTFDGNFVPPNLSYNEVPPCLAIGPYPQSRADVRLMKERGVTGVLNVQTDFDHQCRMINWAHMLQAYESEQLQVLPPVTVPPVTVTLVTVTLVTVTLVT